MEKNNFFLTLILSLLSIAYVLVDWSIGIINFGDILVLIDAGLVLTIGLLTKTLRIQRNQIIILIGLVLLVVLNIMSNLLINPDFSINESIISLCKVIFYTIAFILLYNFIVINRLEYKFLQIISVVTVIVCFIGIYITLAIYLKGVLPYEFFWNFTRNDVASYIYRGYGSIIRTRSLFSEPAHFGFFLNSVLAIICFNRQNYKISKKVDIIITFSIILTLSYGSILIMFLLKLLHYSNLDNVREIIVNSKKYFPIFLCLLLFLLNMGDSIEGTVFKRTQEIFNGEDSSTDSRIEGSWSYVAEDTIFIGNGIGNTPTIYNNFAYILSDLGLIAFVLYLLFNLILLRLNFKLEMVFLVLNIQKGGYLGVGFWILVFLLIIYNRRLSKE
ncbi:hypothetical protein IEO70_04565 [Bacillus sp. AGMB 02131]|uniref:O-antigen ligase domain-containing protein n=1 Tax=Peribacillus faecalis TaxID=2772559 RepID=A0A927HAN5_9BACI|nr:hypothetical protein [Peribacillus faecalis]MBD3107631.1 hypothetical protein [Peribacillus faecalis]